MKLGLVITYADGSIEMSGAWRVPHDGDYHLLNEVGGMIGEEILENFAKTEIIEIRVLPIDGPEWKEIKALFEEENTEGLYVFEDVETPVTQRPLYQTERIEL